MAARRFRHVIKAFVFVQKLLVYVHRSVVRAKSSPVSDLAVIATYRSSPLTTWRTDVTFNQQKVVF